MSPPLETIRVIDLTRLLPGAHCTLLLADLGADVVKVEEPGRGDRLRETPPLVDGHGALHLAMNRGKRSVTIDLRGDGGARLLRRLTDSADVLVESFRPGVADRLGIGYEFLAATNPRLVYAAITGYGQDGPYRDRPGHDIDYAAYVGMIGSAPQPPGDPTMPPVQIADLAAGTTAAAGILAGVLEASRTGRGRVVDVSILDAAASWMGLPWAWHLAGADGIDGRLLSGALACYRLYRTGDGRYVAVGALEPKFWTNLCRALGHPELVPDQFVPDRQEAVAAILQETFAARTREEWVRTLEGMESCVAPVNDVAETLRDPQLRHRSMIAEVGGRAVGPGPAVHLSGGDRGELRPAPRLGEHTDDVLAAVGLSAPEIAELRTAGVI